MKPLMLPISSVSFLFLAILMDLIRLHLQTLNLTRPPTFTQIWNGSCDCDPSES